MPSKSYMIVQKPEYVLMWYEWFNEGHYKPGEFKKVYERHKSLLPSIKPENYMGISRLPISSTMPCFEPNDPVGYIRPPCDAVKKMAEIIELQRNQDPELIDVFDEIMNLDQALIVYDLLGNSRYEYEIMEVSSCLEKDDSILGYDIGGGDFSIICDSMIMPLWHPPSDSAIPSLRFYSEKLNKNMLFPDKEIALQFLGYYSSQLWSEMPAGGVLSIKMIKSSERLIF